MEYKLKCYDKNNNLLVENIHYTIDRNIVTPINNFIIYKFAYNQQWSDNENINGKRKVDVEFNKKLREVIGKEKWDFLYDKIPEKNKYMFAIDYGEVGGGELHIIKPNNINPQHYKLGGIETYDFIAAKLSKEELKGYLKGSILKYISRESEKNGLEDIKKMQWYVNKLVELGE